MIDSTQLFCIIDDFFLKFESIYWNFLKQNFRCSIVRPAQLCISEITFIAIWYKCSHFNNFKAFFTALKYNNSHLFKHLPCYQRMIHLMNTHQLALYALHFALMKDQQSNYLMVEQLVKGMTAKLYADRSYISHELKRWLKDQDIDLMTYHRKNMQVIKLSKADNYHLKQRNKIETLFSLLKGTYNLVTSKARSITGYLTGIYASLCAYQLCHQNKPMIRLMETSA